MDMEDWFWINRIYSFVYLYHHFETESQAGNKKVEEKHIILLL